MAREPLVWLIEAVRRLCPGLGAATPSLNGRFRTTDYAMVMFRLQGNSNYL